jgi:hypothetical protein
LPDFTTAERLWEASADLKSSMDAVLCGACGSISAASE